MVDSESQNEPLSTPSHRRFSICPINAVLVTNILKFSARLCLQVVTLVDKQVNIVFINRIAPTCLFHLIEGFEVLPLVQTEIVGL